MSERYILALDQGTTSTRSIIFDRSLRIVSVSQRATKQTYPKDGWVEQDPEEILATAQATIAQAMEKAGLRETDIAAIGITNQRETTIAWNRKTGESLHPAIVWQDRRTAERCEALLPEQETLHTLTGLVLDPYFSATKMEWLLRHVPKVKIAAENSVLSFGTVDSWLAYHLTDRKAYVTDVSNASRTMLLNLRATAWDDTCLSLFGLRREMLPTVATSSEIVGHTPSGIPIASMIGDQQGALFGQMCFEPGQAKCTYGTGAFLLMNVGTEPKFSANRLLTTIAWKAGNELAYAMEGSVFICGASIDWIVNELGLAPNAASTEQMAYNVRDNGGVYFVPALSGLGAPYWDPQARGLWIGMTQATNRNHLTRSVLEGIAYSVRDLSDTIVTDSGIPLKELKIDGGVSKNTFLQNYQSTVLGLPVLRPKNTETTATGAACLAGLAVGFWKDRSELRGLWEMDRHVYRQKEAEVERQYANWKKAVTRSLDWVYD